MDADSNHAIVFALERYEDPLTAIPATSKIVFQLFYNSGFGEAKALKKPDHRCVWKLDKSNT